MQVNERKHQAINLVLNEMRRQDEKWTANQDLPMSIWNMILVEEVGELAKASLEAPGLGTTQEVIDEVTQVAAVAVQILINCLARDERYNQGVSSA